MFFFKVRHEDVGIGGGYSCAHGRARCLKVKFVIKPKAIHSQDHVKHTTNAGVRWFRRMIESSMFRKETVKKKN